MTVIESSQDLSFSFSLFGLATVDRLFTIVLCGGLAQFLSLGISFIWVVMRTLA